MSDTQRVFFGITIGLMCGLILIILPIENNIKFFITIGLVLISSYIYDKGLPGEKIKRDGDRWNDIEHLRWLYNRLKHVHKVDENYDFMIRFKEIINVSIENDIKDLRVIYNQLQDVYGENPKYDYMIRFKQIINKLGGIN